MFADKNENQKTHKPVADFLNRGSIQNYMPPFQLASDHPGNLIQRKLQELARNSFQYHKAAQLKELIKQRNNSIQKDKTFINTQKKSDNTNPIEQGVIGKENKLQDTTVSDVSNELPVQRKVGFEFQAYDSVTYQDVNGLTPIVGVTVGNGNGFTIEHDDGATANEMEIVTAPVDEDNAGRALLQQQMQDITVLATSIANGVPVTTPVPNIGWLANVNNYHFVVNNGAVHFHPQSTVGVKFEKIGELIDYATSAPLMTGGAPVNGPLGPPVDAKAGFAQQIGWSGQLDQQPFRTAWANGLVNARNDLNGASDNAISFASILYGFAEVSQQNIIPNNANYAKYFMPFMLRLGLLPHFQTLTAHDLLDLQRIDPLVLNTAYLPQQTNDTFNPSTIQQILTALGQGQDIQDLEGIAGYGAYAPNGLGLGMAHNSDIGPSQTEPARNGAVIELRKLGNDVGPGQLTAFALAVFDLIRAINAPAVAVAPPPPVGGGGGNNNNDNGCGCCFLTTACCEFMGLPDDCDELTTLRWFRDHYLATLPQGKELILFYYHVAPAIVKGINKHRNRSEILGSLYRVITDCVTRIKTGKYEEAFHIYFSMTEMLTYIFYPQYLSRQIVS